ncbi:uncharacterized protein LOC116243114 [Phasianus colchicus]|uniref:uncharacterized protein LOC116243114 n=1 Tax=Phasianus colchicus TaxID=9054 RepID=UPI00129D2D14|nr:uncharacterized protein LOC116243114 [Phasianus colchicus]
MGEGAELLPESWELSTSRWQLQERTAPSNLPRHCLQQYCRMESWAERNLRMFHKGKCRFLHLVWSNCTNQYRIGTDLMKRSCEEKDLGILVDSATSQQCALVVDVNASTFPGCIKKRMANRLREAILPLYPVLEKPRLERCVTTQPPESHTSFSPQQGCKRKQAVPSDSKSRNRSYHGVRLPPLRCPECMQILGNHSSEEDHGQ